MEFARRQFRGRQQAGKHGVGVRAPCAERGG
jgi:hypothetical protein